VNRNVLGRHQRHAGDGARAASLAVALLAGALLAGLMAGCGGGGGGTSAATTSAKVSSTTTSTTAEASTTTTPSTTETASGGNGQVGEASPSAAAIAVLTSNDPALVCDRYVTSRYLRTAYGDHQGCVQAQAPGSAADSVETQREADSGAGTVKLSVVPSGGPYDGEKVTVSLVAEGGGNWRVDSLNAHVPVGP
jgi:hypothetical protein